MIEKIPPKGVSFSDFICTFAMSCYDLRKISGKAHDFSRGMKAPQCFFWFSIYLIMVSTEMHPTDSQKYERVHKDGRRERSSANSSRKTRDEYPLNCCTRKCGAYVDFDLTKMWIWSGIVSISTISTSSSSAFSRISSLSRDSISGVRTFLRYLVHQIRWKPRL